MAYQKITGPRSTRFPFMGVGSIGCDCDGLGATTQLPGYDATAQYYKDLVGRVQRELRNVQYNPSAYSSALSKMYSVVRGLSPTTAAVASSAVSFSTTETQQVVLQLLARVGAALVAAKTLQQAYTENYPGARASFDRTMLAVRNGLAAVTVFVQQVTRARTGTSGLGDGELLPALGVGALVAIVLVGLPGLNVVVGAAVAYIVYNALNSTEQAMSDAIRIAREWCLARQTSTGTPCTAEEFAAQVEANKREILAGNENNPINNLINGLISSGTSALKTVLIVGGIAIVAYIGVSLLLRKAVRTVVT